jgi:tetratricopeptide (TPR) repeat protein
VQKYDNAISEYKLALLFDKEHILSMNNLGYLYLNLRKFSEAIDILKKAVAINPQFSWAHYNLALSYYNSGRRNDALRHLEIVIECEPQGSELIEAARKAISAIKGQK